jgi:hypothetical protein
MMPIGSTAMFHNFDVNGIPTTPITNQLVNFGWEYVFHCHILSHEEMDMMRPVSLVVPPLDPTRLTIGKTGTGVDQRIVVRWTDSSITETAFRIERTTDGQNWVTVDTVASPLTGNGKGRRTFVDPTADPSTPHLYRVTALNTVGYGGEFPSLTASSDSVVAGVNLGAIPVAPTGFTATLRDTGGVTLTWRDRATREAGFQIQRSEDNGATWSDLATAPAHGGTGTVSYVDTAVAAGKTYLYRVNAFNLGHVSAWSNTASVTMPALPGAPANVAGSAVRSATGELLTISWSAPTSGGEVASYSVQWSTDPTFATVSGTETVSRTGASHTTPSIARQVWYVRVGASNASGLTWSQPVQVPAAP